ncbi:hypothetical protein P5673_022634 [Acropora cervicornis]|uniref:Uncharacterized protein n=1 Tax=Acropora cervicornis TaxID=6130 RepID=A0AAD9Q6N7_ACRCE|nr:hypothetical protein P5673_022634 [Acropora cervicornis]
MAFYHKEIGQLFFIMIQTITVLSTTYLGESMLGLADRILILVQAQQQSPPFSYFKSTTNIENLNSAKGLHLNNGKQKGQDIVIFEYSTTVETIIARSSQGNTLFLIEVGEWAEIFIRNDFNYNPPLSSRRGRFDEFMVSFLLQIIADESESSREMTVIAHTVLSSECYGKKFSDIKVLKVYEELLVLIFTRNGRILLCSITILKF